MCNTWKNAGLLLPLMMDWLLTDQKQEQLLACEEKVTFFSYFVLYIIQITVKRQITVFIY